MTFSTLSFKCHTYYWQGINPHGKMLSGEIQAVTCHLAKLNLTQQGIVVTQIKKKWWIDFNFFRNNITALEMIIFFHQLATLITSGIPIVQSFSILMQSQENIKLKELIKHIKENIEAGKTLTQSIAKASPYFDSFTKHLLFIGEKTGTLAKVLKRIAHYKEKNLQLKNKIKQAFFYPSIVVFIALIVSLILLTLVIPRFAELFQSMHQSLPALTVGIIQLSHWVRHYFWLGLFFIFPTLLLHYYFKKSSALQFSAWRCLHALPGLGTLFKKITLAQFAQSLSTILASGIPIVDALKIIALGSNNSLSIDAMHILETEVAKGQLFHQALQTSPLFPVLFVQMVKIGEESGRLEQMLEKITEFYESEIDHTVTNLSHALEPLIMIILGVLIGGLVIAMYLPIFKAGAVV